MIACSDKWNEPFHRTYQCEVNSFPYAAKIVGANSETSPFRKSKFLAMVQFWPFCNTIVDAYFPLNAPGKRNSKKRLAGSAEKPPNRDKKGI